MAWRRLGDKPLSEPMMDSLLTHIYASLGLNELIWAQRYNNYMYRNISGHDSQDTYRDKEIWHVSSFYFTWTVDRKLQNINEYTVAPIRFNWMGRAGHPLINLPVSLHRCLAFQLSDLHIHRLFHSLLASPLWQGCATRLSMAFDNRWTFQSVSLVQISLQQGHSPSYI